MADLPEPFGARELVAAVAGARRVLDLGCGSGRLTALLARAGAAVTGLDTSAERLAEARRRAGDAALALDLVEADMDAPLPFAEASLDAAVSRLSLMLARDAASTLREVARVVAPGGRVATAVWASLDRNPWFAVPREAVAAALGDRSAAFAGRFGALGEPDVAADAHVRAGLTDVRARLLEEVEEVADAAAQWERLVRENGHFRRLAAGLGADERGRVAHEVATRLEPYRRDGRLLLPRALVLVTARVPEAA